jgi:hypothetical protein
MEAARDYRAEYERRPEVRMQRDMRLHREVILSRQTDLMPQALAGDAAAHKEMMGLSDLSRTFSATMRDAFEPVIARQLEDRRRRAAEHARRVPAVPPPAASAGWTWVWKDWVLTRVQSS